jgi:hypothetical protein
MMTAMRKHVEPSTKETAFSCPHCGALTTQHWSNLFAKRISSDNHRLPMIFDESEASEFEASSGIEDGEIKASMASYVRKMASGDPFYSGRKQGSEYVDFDINNLFVSQCYNCQKLAVWRHAHLLYPPARAGVEPNQDLAEDIQRDFNEARLIVDQSTRGAAALLRLALQKLCMQLGESGKDIDADIASLVGKGLSPVIQQSLDVVRVIGNESVHPGTIDLRDDRATALELFDLINVIAEQMLSHPKRVKELYERLPERKREGIELRNAKAIEKAQKK